MNPPNKSTTVFPQTEEIPVPLEIHPSVSPLAAELLMKVAEILANEPARYCQAKFSGHRCGAACCILGHMAASAGMRLPFDETGELNAHNLGLTSLQYRRIFSHSLWPECIGAMNLAYKEVTPMLAIARIEHFLRTGQ